MINLLVGEIYWNNLRETILEFTRESESFYHSWVPKTHPEAKKVVARRFFAEFSWSVAAREKNLFYSNSVGTKDEVKEPNTERYLITDLVEELEHDLKFIKKYLISRIIPLTFLRDDVLEVYVNPNSNYDLMYKRLMTEQDLEKIWLCYLKSGR